MISDLDNICIGDARRATLSAEEETYKSKNGIPVYAYRNEHSHSFYISLFVRTGSLYETEEESGISHLLEHIVIRNINKRMDGALYPLLDKYGIEFNASTGAEMIHFYISGSSSHFDIAARIISSVLAPIILDASEVDAERQRVNAEIREASESTSLGAFTSREVWGTLAPSRPVAGTMASVKRHTRKRLEGYRQKTFTKENIFLYVTGNANNDNINCLLDCLSDYKLGEGEAHTNCAPVPDNFGKRDRRVKIKQGDFTKISFSFDLDLSVVKNTEIDLLYDVMLGGYSSDMFMELSERNGYCYDISGSIERYRNIGVFTFSYEVREAKLYDAVELTMQLLERYKSIPLPEERCMKAGYTDNAYMLYDDTRELNYTMAYDDHILDLGYRSLEQRARAYSLVTPHDLTRVAKIVFSRDNLTVTVKGNKRKADITRLENIIFGG